ncbi:MAG: aminotransferase class V-fold PLP-dependent enzyme, partial [Pseudomonadota bacterium]
MELDVARVRADFPILRQLVRGKPLVYLDNAATTQKPVAVIEALNHYYRLDNANIHRGVHTLSERATAAYEGARATVRRFINARATEEIVFVRGATEAINLVAQTWGRANVKAGDEILLSEMEHHSNIVPWQMLCQQVGATLKVIPINDAGELQLDRIEALLTARTRLVGITHCSNALGTINPVREIIEQAHAAGAAVLVDGAQAVAHLPVDVQMLDCDFYVFSSHKLYGPTGTGVLYA